MSRSEVGWRRHGAAAFACLGGVLLGLSLLKLGNPVILDRLVRPPTSLWEALFEPWPVAWGYGLLAVVALLGVAIRFSRAGTPPASAGPSVGGRGRWRGRLVVLPALWLAWQGLAASRTIEPRLTWPTLVHFGAVVAGFYAALFVLARSRGGEVFWTALLIGFLLMLWVGFGQHYGGLEETRRYIYSQPGWEQLPPEQLKRLGSNRIFATLLYPNTLAGVLLLLLPAMLVTVWRGTHRWHRLAGAVATGLLAYAGSACLVWSGSKAGWLIALAMGWVLLLHLPLPRVAKWLLLAGLLLAGLAGFFLRFSTYFSKGATSVGARFDYWAAGWKTACRYPWLGAGPGTFSVTYARLKPPRAEMARLAHNDYLEQASDSGFIGAALYLAFVAGSLVVLHRTVRGDPRRFAVWLGLLGWALQGCVEFGLYIPATAWTGFWLLGWLWGRGTGPRHALGQADLRPRR